MRITQTQREYEDGTRSYTPREDATQLTMAKQKRATGPDDSWLYDTCAMKQFTLPAVVLALLLGALWFAKVQRQQSLAYILAHYPPNPALDRTFELYLHPDQNTKNLVFSEIWFRHRTETMATQCDVRRAGDRACYGGTSFRALNSVTSLAPAQLSAIQSELQAGMPPSQNPAALEQLLVIGFWQGDQWTARAYDRADLPDQITRIHQIMGAKK